MTATTVSLKAMWKCMLLLMLTQIHASVFLQAQTGCNGNNYVRLLTTTHRLRTNVTHPAEWVWQLFRHLETVCLCMWNKIPKFTDAQTTEHNVTNTHRSSASFAHPPTQLYTGFLLVYAHQFMTIKNSHKCGNDQTQDNRMFFKYTWANCVFNS